IAASTAFTQVRIGVIVRSPMPASLNEWRRDRSLVQVVITNTAGNAGYRNAEFDFTVRNIETGDVVARSKERNPNTPRFTIPPGPASLVRYGPDVIDDRAVDVNGRYREIALATNGLPEGHYEFCLRLLDERGSEIAITGNACGRFTVALPEAPVLLQ